MNTTNMIANEIISLAKENLGGRMLSSALLCLADANALLMAGDDIRAGGRAVDSLRYSVGILHPAYAKAHQLIDGFKSGAQ